MGDMATIAKKLKMEADPTTKESSITSLLQLGNECLQKVLSFLNVRELMKIEAVCKDFKAVAEEIYKEKRSLDFESLFDWELPPNENEDEDEEVETMNDSISLNEAENIFRRVGAYVKTLKMKGDLFFGKDNPLDFVWKYCQKLEEVSFEEFIFDDEICTKLAGVFSNVKDVGIDDAFPITDGLLQTTFNLQKLKRIHLSFATVEGDFLTHLRDILEVILIFCRSLKIDKFMNFIEANPQLTNLDIKNCSQIDGNCLKAIGRKLVNLDTLAISTNYTDATVECYLPMMDLPKLTTLMIDFSCLNDEESGGMNMGALLARVASHDRLKNLFLLFWQYIVTDEMAQAINKLTKLKQLCFKDTPMCIWNTLGDIKCAETLEELEVNDTKLSTVGLANVIKKCKKIRCIDATGCHRLGADFVSAVEEDLRARRCKLVIDLRLSSVCEEDVGFYDYDKLKLIF